MAAIVKAAQTQNWRNQFDAQIAAVISNKADAAGLVFAKEQGIPSLCINHISYATRESFEADLMQKIDTYQPSLLVLAGFMRLLTPAFVAHYAGRIVNIHPSLLPAFTGLNTHQRAIDAGCKFAGASVHRVSSELDSGAILAQAVVPILPDDTKQTLAARVLTQEHLMYPQVIASLLKTSVK